MVRGVSGEAVQDNDQRVLFAGFSAGRHGIAVEMAAVADDIQGITAREDVAFLKLAVLEQILGMQIHVATPFSIYFL